MQSPEDGERCYMNISRKLTTGLARGLIMEKLLLLGVGVGVGSYDPSLIPRPPSGRNKLSSGSPCDHTYAMV